MRRQDGAKSIRGGCYLNDGLPYYKVGWRRYEGPILLRATRRGVEGLLRDTEGNDECIRPVLRPCKIGGPGWV